MSNKEINLNTAATKEDQISSEQQENLEYAQIFFKSKQKQQQ